MEFPIIDAIIMGIGSIFTLIWIVIFLLSLKYVSLFDSIEEKEFPLKEIYCFGYYVMEILHYTYKNKEDRRMRDRLEILYDPQFAEYYLRVIYAQRITIASVVFLCSFILYGLSGEIIMLIMVIGYAGLAYYYFGQEVENKINKRTDSMLNDFTEVVSKLALLTNAGMILREAWEKIAYTGESVLYVEMQQVVEDMRNGLPEAEAIRQFGVRCMMPEAKKFSSTIIQGIEKGNKELTHMLQQQSNEVWNMKKHLARRKGEKAKSQLIIPMMIMLVGIIILVVIPIFTNLGM